MSFDISDLILNAPGNVFWKGVDGYYLGCNRNQSKILGLNSPEDIVGKTIFDLLPQEMAEEIEANDIEVMKGGREQIFEERCITPKGGEALYLSRKIPYFNEKGEVIGLLGIATDITHYKKREEALTSAKDAAEQNLAKIVSYLPGNIFWKSADHRYLGCNDNLAKIYRLKSPQDVIGKRNIDISVFTQDMASLAEANDTLVMESKKEMIFEEQGLDLEGNSATYLSRKMPLFEDGNVVGTLGVALDITERKKFEQELKIAKKTAEEAIRVQTNFLMNMSHDLRTPLSGVMGFLDILKSQEDDDKKKEMLELAYISSKRLLKIIEEILDVVNADATQELEIGPVNLAQLINETIDLLHPELQCKGLVINTKIDPGLPEHIQSDEKKLDKLLLNLITNAVKFTSEGSISVEVNVLEKTNNQVKLQICVKDTGCGIALKDQERIFERFIRANDAMASKTTGSGLGLWFVKKIINDLDGNISVSSEIGKGTTFTCIFSSIIY